MRKLTAILLALCLLAPLTCAVHAGGNLTLALSQAEGRVGDTVEVTLSLKNNPGIISLQAQIKYDEEKLELLSVKDGGILGKEIKHQEAKTSPYTLSWENYVSEESFTEDGVACTLRFRVLSGEAGEEIPVTMTVGDYGVMDLDLKDLARKVEYGSVSVLEGKGASPVLPAVVLGCIALFVVSSTAAVVIWDHVKRKGKKKDRGKA